MPSSTFLKVKAMPPPMMISSALSSRLLMSGILSAIFAPPRMASSGRFGLSSTAAKALSSFSMRKPAALSGRSHADHRRVRAVRGAEGVVDVDVAELREAGAERRDLRGIGRFLGAVLALHLAFLLDVEAQVFEQDDVAGLERRRRRPRLPAPTQSSRNFTGLPSSSASLSATGLSENFATFWPSGRPRWLASTTEPPFSRMYRIVGSAATMRSVLVIAPVVLSCGTLKSTRTRTRLPATSTSRMESLAMDQ